MRRSSHGAAKGKAPRTAPADLCNLLSPPPAPLPEAEAGEIGAVRTGAVRTGAVGSGRPGVRAAGPLAEGGERNRHHNGALLRE